MSCEGPSPEAAAPAADPAAADTAWAFAVAPAFGEAVAAGYAALNGRAGREARLCFHRALRAAGREGAAPGRLLAEILPPVLLCGEAEVRPVFFRVWEALAAIGLQALQGLLSGVPRLLSAAAGRPGLAALGLEVLEAVAASRPTHEEIRRFTRTLPPAFLRIAGEGDAAALRALRELARLDRRLLEPFLAGREQGLDRLGEAALSSFVAEAARLLARQGRSAAAAFLALETEAARRHLGAFREGARLRELGPRLARYLRARLGRPLAVRPLAEFAAPLASGRMVVSDGRALYLPEEIAREGGRRQNEACYRLLAGLEASFHEFGTFAFPALRPQGAGIKGFLAGFPDPAFAGELFGLLETVRVARCLARRYPGLAARLAAALAAEEEALPPRAEPTLTGLLRLLVGAGGEESGAAARAAGILRPLADGLAEDASVADTALQVERAYEALDRLLAGGEEARRLCAPFGWRPWPHPGHETEAGPGRRGRRGVAGGAPGLRRAPTAESRPGGAEGGAGPPGSAEEAARGHGVQAGAEEDAPALHAAAAAAAGGKDAFRYPEWDEALGDYLPDHVTVYERPSPAGPPGFYAAALARRAALVRAARRAFERLRPEGLRRLRGWREGEAFDYGRLLDYAVDRRRGGVPEERIFVKHLPDRRDVAVLLLVDASRSTAAVVPDAGASVLAVEQEALVILCEALGVLGDAFAVAAFSGSGRRHVDYRVVKGFDDPWAGEVRDRIGGLLPQRNTRLGAALRHAGRRLGEQPARVRLLVLLSDGFPNDAGYRAERAVADTRRALTELAFRGIRFHAVTVNHPAEARLDRLYGRARHHVISDVRALSGRLLRTYRGLTR